MNKNERGDVPDLHHLEQRIANLENRLNNLESGTVIPVIGDKSETDDYNVIPSDKQVELSNQQNEAFESRIGEYGMAWLGNIVLLIGILFLTQLLQNSGRDIISMLFGFASVGFVYLIGYFTRKSIPYMSRLFNFSGHLLLYIQTARITLFQGSQIIENPVLSHAFVIIIIIALIYLALRNDSQVLLVITWIMVVITAISSGYTHTMLSLTVALTAAALIIVNRKGWWASLIIACVLTYFTFLIWIFGNPFKGGTLEIISVHQNGYLYLFACAIGYSLLGLLPQKDKHPGHLLNSAILVNGISFSVIMLLVTLAFFPENYSIFFGLIAAFCLAYSVWLKIRQVRINIAVLYAIYSFVALSICVVGIYHFPLAFVLLSIESLLVVSMALWFRSRNIVIMNTLLFAGLIIVYFATASPYNSINFSFALTALVTARVINWKKKRLNIRTEMIRNFYLLTGAAMVLFSLHEAVSVQFVTLSWALAALGFFVLSVLIHNMKYRWLAITTMVVTVFYLFIVDLSNISLGYRIIALMFIAAVSLGISIFYSRRQKNRKEEG